MKDSNNNKTKLLILNKAQFGYHMDTYYYCKFAHAGFDILYYGFDANKDKLEVQDVNVRYVSIKGNVLSRYLRLLISFVRQCRKDHDVIFINYFVGCSVLKLLNRSKRFVLDIRTASVSGNPARRRLNDLVMRLESRFFKHVSVISQSLADKLKLSRNKVHILPLGAKPTDVQPKKFDSLHLLYVGTFSGRQIENTIEGFARFHSEYGTRIETTYDIVGNGHNGELDKLRHLVGQKGLSSAVRLPGYIHHDQLEEYYQRCNIGVSYIPINDIYDCQPPTKTFEYILAGMPVIATETKENAIVINESNGVLIEDTAENFHKGLKTFVENKEQYNSDMIKQEASRHSWDAIVNNNFIPYIYNIIK